MKLLVNLQCRYYAAFFLFTAWSHFLSWRIFFLVAFLPVLLLFNMVASTPVRVAPAFDVWHDLEEFMCDYVSKKTKIAPGKRCV